MALSGGDARLALVEYPDGSAAKNKTLLFFMKTGCCKRLIIAFLFLQLLHS
jgi:hypothetical protein